MYFLWIENVCLFLCVLKSCNCQRCVTAARWSGRRVLCRALVMGIWVLSTTVNNWRYLARSLGWKWITWFGHIDILQMSSVCHWRKKKISNSYFLIVIKCNCKVCAILTSPHHGRRLVLGRQKKLQKINKICTKRDHFLCNLMFAVTSYTVHSKTKICYSIHTTRHITLKCSLSDRKCIIIYIYIYICI